METTFKHYQALRTELTRWLEHSTRNDPPSKNRGGEDEANYALAWVAHYLVTGDPEIERWMRSLFADLANWVKSDCHHGYEPEAEAHHGTEPFLLFLPRFIGLFPENAMAKSLIDDAAHHIGNWVSEIPPWYDYDGDRFFSYSLGTRTIGKSAAEACEAAEHFRFIHIALAAYRASADDRYLEWALRYGRKRSERIIEAAPPMPLLWDLDGNGLRSTDINTKSLKAMSGEGHHIPGDPLAGIENMLASGAVNALGDLFELSGDDIFHRAVIRIIEPLINELPDPYGDPAAAAIVYFRQTFNDTSFDDRIRKVLEPALDATELEVGEKLAMVFPEENKRRESGVGKRSDMIYWGRWREDGSIAPFLSPCTAALTLAFQLTGDISFAGRAFKSAATKLTMARRVLRGGREHSDMGGAICSVAAGHGRNWGQGAVTGCYGPLLLGTREIMGETRPLILVRDDEGNLKVPETLLPLARPPAAGPGTVSFFAGGEQPVRFSWKVNRAEAEWNNVLLRSGESAQYNVT